MSFLRKLFGGKKKENKKSLNEHDLLREFHSTQLFLMAKREMLDKNIKKEITTIKANVKINKPVALNALKRKKIYEKQLSEIDDMLLTLIKQNLLILKRVSENTILVNSTQ